MLRTDHWFTTKEGSYAVSSYCVRAPHALRHDLFQPRGDYSYDEVTGDKDENVDTKVKMFLNFSRRIALGQLFKDYQYAENLVLASSRGPYESMVRTAGLELIHETAGTNNLGGVLQMNLGKLVQFAADVGRYQQEGIGKGMRAVKGATGSNSGSAGAVQGAAQ